MSQVNVPQIVDYLMTKSNITDLIDKIYWGVPKEWNKLKPYVVVNIVSDVPDPISTASRIEFRIISNNQKVTNKQIFEIDNQLALEINSTNLFWTFATYNVVMQEGQNFLAEKNRKEFIRDYLFYFVN